jgi:hypothetical protein
MVARVFIGQYTTLNEWVGANEMLTRDGGVGGDGTQDPVKSMRRSNDEI